MRLPELEFGDKAAAAGVVVGDRLDPVGAVDAGARTHNDAETIGDSAGITFDGDGSFAGVALAGCPVGGGLLPGFPLTGPAISMVVARLGAEARRLFRFLPDGVRRVVPTRPDLAVLGAAEGRGDVPGVQVLAGDRRDRGRVADCSRGISIR